MKKSICKVFTIALFLGVLFVFWSTREAMAVGLWFNFNFGPPPIVVAEPPEVVMIPHSQIYYVPDPKIEVFFFEGFWWSPRWGKWYRSNAYNGPWGGVSRRSVPAALHGVPGNYRNIYRKEKHIPYGQWKKQGHHQPSAKRNENWQENKHDNRYDGRKDNKYDNRYDGRKDNKYDSKYDSRKEDKNDNKYGKRQEDKRDNRKGNKHDR